MDLSRNLLLYFVVSMLLGYILCVRTKKSDGTSRVPWLFSGLVIGLIGALANLGAIAASLPFGNTFNLDQPLTPTTGFMGLDFLAFLPLDNIATTVGQPIELVMGSLFTGLLIGLPIGLIVAYDMSKRFTLIDGWLLFFKVAIIFVVIGGTIASLSVPRYSQEQWLDFLIFGLAQGGIYALIALGYTLVYGILFMINFAHGEVFMAGAFTAFFAAEALATPAAEGEMAYLDSNPVSALAIVFLVAMVTSTVVAVLLERIAYRPLRRAPRLVPLITAIGASFFLQYTFRGFYGSGVKAYPEVQVLEGDLFMGDLMLAVAVFGVALISYLLLRLTIYGPLKRAFSKNIVIPPLIVGVLVLVAIFGLSQIVQEQLIIQLNTMPLTQATATELGISQFSEYPLPTSKIQFLIIVASIVMMAGLYIIVQRTKIGKAMRAVAEDKDVAALMGIDVDRIITITFALGAALAGAAGVLYALMFHQVQFFMGFLPGLKAFTAAVLGGIGSIPGAMLGGFFLGVVESLGPSLFLEGLGIPAAYQLKDVIAFTMLVLVLIFRPAGIMGIDLSKKKA